MEARRYCYKVPRETSYTHTHTHTNKTKWYEIDSQGTL